MTHEHQGQNTDMFTAWI